MSTRESGFLRATRPSTRARPFALRIRFLPCRHVSYTFCPGLWLAVDGTWYGGGEAFIDDGPGKGRLNNTRIGATLAIPFGKRQAAKLSYSRGASVRFGQNFDTVGAAWQIRWF